ncbi:cysteine and histidine-rich domain-containing protein 1 [Nilaparvata lugens]|uniref:cysteine and histidine-rich domain-containing protein 1 n=1 Tax=Nilaparvata lugens TaxID=108931 RepID=UPI00193C892E|nr:cysteine and histidine-rich domain-containing protein 1 [Nilaparvata lugens]
MPTENKGDNLLLCYNKGCAKKFDPSKNTEDSCSFHSGAPVFHDAYKGWSCCKKKCTDFTEFLNIKGCCKSYHSNVKPVEPEKPEKISTPEVIEYRAPEEAKPPALERPPFDTPLVTLKVEVSDALKRQSSNPVKKSQGAGANPTDDGTIAIGTPCKNNSCKVTYEGPQTLETDCICHPGVPIFHEGLKYWSCCVRRTTDFKAFLDQAGCATVTHLWRNPKSVDNKELQSKCRLDWHQTPTFVVVSVFCKNYDPDSSLVQLSPIRLKLSVFFPEENGAYCRDIELRGVVDVAKSSVAMTPAKVEIKLRKAEPGSWSQLEFPRSSEPPPKKSSEATSTSTSTSNLASRVDAVDLSDL